jgi:DNA polymerase III epsilon subunit family exonuclease
MTFQNKNNRSFKPAYKTVRKEQSLPTEIITNPNRPQWLNLLPSQMDIVFFDLETTGGNPYNSSIIEIGAIKYKQGKEVARFETLINPKRHIPSIVQKITKINNEMVSKAPTIKEIFDDFIKFIGNSIIVAHGAQGDIAYLTYHIKEFKNEEFKNFYFCTHLIVSNILNEIPSKTLTGVANYFEIPILEAHNALADAEMTANVFWKLIDACERHGFKSCDDILKIQSDAETIRKLGPGINPAIVENIPTTPGLLFVLNSHHEISYLTASSSIRKSLQQLTEIGLDREMNKIIVDASGFKFERCSSLLDSLIQEKKELKRISLSIDPRKSQSRSENFLQIFIPDDMLDYARVFPEKVPFLIPQHGELHIEEYEEDETYISENKENTNLYVTFGEQDDAVIPITRTRRNASIYKSDKFKISRRRNNDNEALVRIGHLKEGIGYCFGPFQQPKVALSEIQEIIKCFPFEHNSFTMQERFAHLRVIISLLNGNIHEEINRIEKTNKKIKAIKNFSRWLRSLNLLREIKNTTETLNTAITKQIPKSGLCLISNNDFKEFDIAIIVRGRVAKKTRLPFEQAERLKSARYFTRLFENYYDEIVSPLSPIIFTDDVCSDMELFSYWLHNRKGEGEWVDFFDLEGLYNTSIL